MSRFKKAESRRLKRADSRKVVYVEQRTNDTWRSGKTTAQRGYGGRWQKARLTFLSKNPLCAECQRSGRTTAATAVDHIVPHRGNSELFWDTTNWQPLCKPCHDEKTLRGE
jgi:5-methylcytosine-specific restriction endonuclease McrA